METKKTTKVPIKGIQRLLNCQDDQWQDGWTDELINWRLDNGKLEPIGTPKKLYNVPELDEGDTQSIYDQIWIHDQDNIKNYIGQANDFNLRLMNVLLGTSTLIRAYNHYVQVHFIKKFMIVIHNDGMDRFVWDNDKNEYYLAEIINRPLISFAIDAMNWVETEKTDTVVAQNGKFFKSLNERSQEQGAIAGTIAFRYALKLFDGSYVLHSLPIIVEPPYEQNPLAGGSAGYWWLAYTDQYYPFRLRYEDAFFKYIIDKNSVVLLEGLEDLIQSVVVFASKAELPYDIKDDSIEEGDLAATSSYKLFSELFEMNGDFKDIADSASWYNVAEITFSDLIDQAASAEKRIDLKDFYQDYATREVLPVDQFSHHSISGKVGLVFNSRLLLADITTVFGSYRYDQVKYSLNSSEGYSFIGNKQCYFLVTISTDQGEVQKLIDIGLKKFYENPLLGDTLVKYTNLGRVIGYPDRRANKIAIVVVHNGLSYKIREWELKKSSSMNYSYYHTENWTEDLQNDTNFAEIIVGSAFMPVQQINLAQFSAPSYNDRNGVQASEVSNPFFYPAKYRYQVGTGKITDLATNTEPLSSGQFGEHPLQVFTNSGVWAMVQGDGDVVYSNVVPSSGEVANPGTVTSVGNGVVFTTPTGIYLLQGRTPIELTKTLKGSPNTMFQANPNYKFYINDVRLVTGMDSVLSSVDILDYITNCKIGFNKVQEELLVTNLFYPYSYVYSFKSGYWFKRSESYRVLIHYYPNLYALKETGENTGIINMSDEDYTGYTQVLITTQPMNFGTDAFKLIERTALRTIHEAKDSTHPGFYIFGSSDLINWQRLIGRNHLTGTKRDLLLTRIGSKFKYFIAVFAANMKQDGYVAAIDFQYRLKMANKLR